jgi:hypothetical protein
MCTDIAAVFARELWYLGVVCPKNGLFTKLGAAILHIWSSDQLSTPYGFALKARNVLYECHYAAGPSKIIKVGKVQLNRRYHPMFLAFRDGI